MNRMNSDDDVWFVRKLDAAGDKEVTTDWFAVGEDLCQERRDFHHSSSGVGENGSVDVNVGMVCDDVVVADNVREKVLDEGLGIVMKGVYCPTKFDVDVLIIAEKWPSWVWFVQTYSWHNVVALVKKKLGYKHIWNLDSVGFKPWSFLRKECIRVGEAKGWIFMQGSYSFLQKMEIKLQGWSVKVSRVGCCPAPGKDTKLSTDELELGVLSH